VSEPRRHSVEQHEVCHDGFFRLERYRLRHTLFGGGWSPPLTRELLERGHAVAVLPYDPLRDEVVLIEQFRIGALHSPGGPWLIEIVAGIIEEGEKPADVAHREAREEAGLEIFELEPICHYLVSPGGTSESIHLYCGRVDASTAGGIHGVADEGEDIRAFSLPTDDALKMMRNGLIDVASPLIALQWLELNRRRLRVTWGAME